MRKNFLGVILVVAMSLALGAGAWGVTGSKRIGGTIAFLAPLPSVIVVGRLFFYDRPQRNKRDIEVG